MEIIKLVKETTFTENNLEKTASYIICRDGDNYYRRDYYSCGRESPLYLVKPVAKTVIEYVSVENS